MERVFITGATGFIGRALTERLLSCSAEVYALVRPKSKGLERLASTDQLKIITGDTGDILKLSETMPSLPFDAFYHLAWDGVEPSERNDFDLQMANVTASADCVKAAVALGVKKFVFIGSTMEYQYNGKPINETAVPSPANHYGAAKIAAHYLCRQLALQSGVDFLYAVATSVYGPGREDSNVITHTVQKLLRGEKPSLTRLEQRWDYIHIDDLTDALYRIGTHGKPDGFYALGKGENLPLLEFLYIVRDLIDPSLPLGIGEIAYPEGRIPSSCIDLTALTEDTGFVPKISFREGIVGVIDHYRKRE